jgi:heme/copper-type cytochrome/quinol oxidase subunit 2
MRAAVRAVTPEEYQAWADKQATDIENAEQALSEQRKRREGEVIP